MSNNLLPARPEFPDLTDLIAEVQAMPVTSQNYPEICEALIEVKAKYKQLDEEEHKITRPINEALKAARGWFKKPKDTYTRLEQLFKGKVAEHQYELQAQKRAAFLEISAGSVDARHTLAELAQPPHPPEIQTREVWDMEITDASQIPGSFWIVDEAKLRSLAGSGLDVPGVRYFKRPVIAVRGR